MSKKIYFVAGASGGLGQAICEEIAKNNEGGGCIIVGHLNRDTKVIQELQKRLLEQYNTELVSISANFESEKEVENLANEIIARFGKVDVFVHAAGIVIDKEIKDRTYADFEKTFRINVFSAFYLAKTLGRVMFENKSGKIVFISSVSATENYPTSIDYDASKASLNTMTKNFAIEFAPYVNVNAVAPGMIDTPFNYDLPKDVAQTIASKILKRRWAKPQEIAGLVYCYYSAIRFC